MKSELTIYPYKDIGGKCFFYITYFNLDNSFLFRMYYGSDGRIIYSKFIENTESMDSIINMSKEKCDKIVKAYYEE